MAYPEWVEKQKRPGTNISCIHGKYYLYEATSVWDPEKKRARKKTGKYLGRITEDGLIPPREKKQQAVSEVATKECGACTTLNRIGKDIHEKLKEYFPSEADRIFSLAVLRVIEKCPFKRAAFLYERSFLSEIYGDIPMSSASLSAFLQELGTKRPQFVGFMKEYLSKEQYVLFDGTNIISNSDHMDINRIGYNSHRQFDPQINLLYAFSACSHTPGYYRVLPGNIRDVSAFKQCVQESAISNMVVVADKGFGSEANFKMLEDNGLKYIVPLKRNNSAIQREKLKTGNKADFDGHFRFNNRVVWYYSYFLDGKHIYVYLDSDLRNKEEKDYIRRIDENCEDYSVESFMEKQYDFGVIAFRTNINDTAENLFHLYKTRGEIEQSFDFLKNLLEQDHTYLQSIYSVEAWAFINHISLMLVYAVYARLKSADLLSKYSVSDFLIHLKYIHAVKINSSWVTGEISGKTQKLLDALKIHIT